MANKDNDLLKRVKPINIEAEKSLLSTMFLSSYSRDRAFDTLRTEDFVEYKNQLIFDAMRSVSDKVVELEVNSIVNELRDRNKFDACGGLDYISEVLLCESVASNSDYYLKLVKDAAIRRNVIDLGENISRNAYNSDVEIENLIEEAEKNIVGISRSKASNNFRFIDDVMREAEEKLEMLCNQKGDITGIPYGWKDIDSLTSGMHDSQLIIVAARPGMGKTVFALNVAANVAKYFKEQNIDKTVALFNLEMDAVQLMNRIFQSEGQISGYKFRAGKFDDEDWQKLGEAKQKLSGAKLCICDTAESTIGEIRSSCRKLAASKNGLGLVIIDYLQLLKGNANYAGNRQQEVSDISRTLKLMAKELNVPVIALSQLSRKVEERDDKRPMMSDLRESGSIEQDADIVAFLYREGYYRSKAISEHTEGSEKTPEQIESKAKASLSEFIVAKHRNGNLQTVNLVFSGDTSTFADYDEKKEEKGD